MGNIITYLKRRGNQTFSERPFCEVDNLVLSELAYWDMRGIVPEIDQEKSVTLGRAARLYEAQHEHKAALSSSQNLLRVMASTDRYRNVRLSRYADVLDERTHTEFSALQIDLGDGTAYVAFRGSGDYILGWREDFGMSFQKMGSQEMATAYLEKTIEPGKKYRVGGHSKGGNLAVYASMMCPAQKRTQIIEIYNNDGPGLCRDIIDMKRYKRIRSRLIRIVPEYSVIGMLFANEPPTKIVASTASGLAQHDAMSWVVEGDSFLRKQSLSKECQIYDRIFDEWIEEAPMEQRKAFTRDFFDALEAGGSKRFSQLGKGGPGEFAVILLAILRSESMTKSALGRLLKALFTAHEKIWKHFSSLAVEWILLYVSCRRLGRARDGENGRGRRRMDTFLGLAGLCTALWIRGRDRKKESES
jgi:hypothetical protein